MKLMALTQERLTEFLNYDCSTGVFTQKKRSSRRVKVGDVAGTTKHDGYVIIRVDGVRYRAHRLAWLFMTGELPILDIDHIDRNPSNNAFSNLRLCNQSQNNENIGLRRDNKSQFKGVCLDAATGLWRSEIRKDGVTFWLGRHAEKDSAINARYEAELKHHLFAHTSSDSRAHSS